ncbi:MAG: potassium transporter Trk [Mycobacterium sp.]
MGDLVSVLILLAFFGLCALYIRGCDRMIRKDEIGEPTVELSREAAEQL